MDRYASTRDRPDRDETSRLSPYLRFGCVHPRQVLDRLDAGRGDASFRRELCWRDFYADVLFHRPDSAREPLDRRTAGIEVDLGHGADERFDAWREGRTGYPLVDAGMRHLRAEGWMPNRVRMVTASFFVKDLHLPWQRGAREFMRAACRRRPGLEQPRVAVDGGNRDRRRALLTASSTRPCQGRAVRSRRGLHPALGPRARRDRTAGDPPPVGPSRADRLPATPGRSWTTPPSGPRRWLAAARRAGCRSRRDRVPLGRAPACPGQVSSSTASPMGRIRKRCRTSAGAAASSRSISSRPSRKWDQPS